MRLTKQISKETADPSSQGSIVIESRRVFSDIERLGQIGGLSSNHRQQVINPFRGPRVAR